ncbi:MAG TPA: hypothetical protein DC054_17715 [Blastocatellia bacterium]|nr:hypothetical protein [Blastocatellia bacterium]
MLKTYRVLRSMLVLGEFTTRSLEQHTGINPTTIGTIVQRKLVMLDRVGLVESGQPGGKLIRYKLKPEAEATLRDEIGSLFDDVRELKSAWPEPESSLKAPLGLLSAENIFLKRFVDAPNLTEKVELLRLAEQDLESAQAEVKAFASDSPEKAKTVEAIVSSVKALGSLAEAERSAQSGNHEDAYRAIGSIYDQSDKIRDQLQLVGQTARANAFRERIFSSPLFPALIVVATASSRSWAPARMSAAAGARSQLFSSTVGNRQAIAVMPLVGNKSAQPYLCAGITRGIWSKVCELPDLTVVAPSRVPAHTANLNTPESVQALGRELNVQTMLFGDVAWTGKQLSCNAQLLSAESGAPMWQKRYKIDFGNVFSVEEDISRRVSEELHIELTASKKAQLAERPTTDSDAYKLYMEGRYNWMQWTAEGIELALEYFEKALKKDRFYALAHAGMADCYNMCTYELGVPPGECFPKAKAAAYEALEFDENLAEAYTALAYSRLRFYWNWKEAEESYLRALELNPNYILARLWYAEYLAAAGHFEEAIAQVKEAERLDPESLIVRVTAGSIYYFAGQYEQAISQFLRTLESDDNFVRAHFRLGGVYLQTGAHAEAIKELSTAVRLSHRNPREQSSLGYAYAVCGDHVAARKVLVTLKRMSRRRYVSSYNLGLIYTGLGEVDAAFQWLDKACKERDPWLVFLRVDPRLSALRSDPRFGDLSRRVGFVPAPSALATPNVDQGSVTALPLSTT